MRLPPLSTLSACALLAASSAPASQIVRDVVETSLVPSPVEYAALLPDGYDGQGEPLPLLLMLHGSSRDREEIARRQPQIERLWREGGLPEMVVATPSVPAGTIYLDSYDGSAQWETFLMKEFLPYLRRRFHAGPRAQDDDGHGHFDGRARRAASCFQIPRNLRRGGRDGTRRLAGALLGRDARSEQNPPRRKPRQSFRRPLRRVALAGRQSGVDRRRRPPRG